MSTPFFNDLAAIYPELDPLVFAQIGNSFEEVFIAGGDTLMRFGEVSDGLYVLLSGRLIATRLDNEGRTVHLNEIGRGEIVGELSALTGDPRTATVIAVRDSRLIHVSNDAFLRIMQRHPSVIRQLFRLVVRRLEKGNSGFRERLSTVTLVSGGETDEAASFGRQLVNTLTNHVSLLVLDWAAVTEKCPNSVENEHDVAAWLNDLERQFSLLVLIGARANSRWTNLCIRQADRVLVVASTTGDPGLNELEERLRIDSRNGHVHKWELVLLHEAGTRRPQGSARWRCDLNMLRYHHLLRGDSTAIERLARHLVGKSVGLVLGGGGARALAEIGVLRALQEANIPIDVIGGTSMGAVIGALVALGHDADAIEKILRDALRQKPFADFGIPRVSLLRGRRLSRLAQLLFGDINIEDLWRKYFCISCNLSRGSIVVSEAGMLRKWVTASAAVPGIMPPLIENDELFVDGGLLNNLPADVMQSRNSGPIISVNVSNVSDLTVRVPQGAPPSRSYA